ncbi:MAG: hypothetical protein E6I91_05800 [Chloroflexi bacterium]|nr:MAG: hypothetical protein E6I91_05800 [Chloroflexota bacterium]
MRDHMQPGEIPLLAVPAIWDSGKEQRSVPCEVIVTNQRLIGYYAVDFPRKRSFLEEHSLSTITSVTLRHKTYEPLFRELMVRDGQSKLYVRAPRRQIEALYAALHSAIDQYLPVASRAFEDTAAEQEKRSTPPQTSAFGRQDIRTSFSSSPLAIVILFVGGLMLEVISFGLWLVTQSIQVGLPLFVAGLIAVLTSILLRRQRQSLK